MNRTRAAYALNLDRRSLRIGTLILLLAAAFAPGTASAGISGAAAGEVDHACTVNSTAAFGIPWAVSGANMREACGNLYGYPGYSAIKPCQPPSQSGRIGDALRLVHENVRDEPPCKPNVRDQLNATAAAERRAFATLDESCAASGGGDARKGLCRALYGNLGYGSAQPCAIAPWPLACTSSAREGFGLVPLP